jgi:hypothetical protein
MQDATLLTEKRGWNGNNPEHDGVQPDEGIEDEIGPQKAEPAMFSDRNSGSRSAILRCESDGA